MGVPGTGPGGVVMDSDRMGLWAAAAVVVCVAVAMLLLAVVVWALVEGVVWLTS